LTELEVEGRHVGFDSSREETRHYDKDLGDAFEDWDGGGGGYAHFRYSRFVGLFDGAWVQTDGDDGSWLTNKLFDLKVGYRAVDLNPRPPGTTSVGGRHFFLDALVGARYREAEPDLGDSTRLDIDEVRDWVDPVFGIRTGVELIPNLTFETVADVGGFNIGNASRLTWSLNPRLNYRAWDHLDLFIGWKHLSDDHTDDLKIDLSGPEAGIGYSF
jgi:hypothetical protein